MEALRNWLALLSAIVADLAVDRSVVQNAIPEFICSDVGESLPPRNGEFLNGELSHSGWSASQFQAGATLTVGAKGKPPKSLCSGLFCQPGLNTALSTEGSGVVPVMRSMRDTHPAIDSGSVMPGRCWVAL